MKLPKDLLKLELPSLTCADCRYAARTTEPGKILCNLRQKFFLSGQRACARMIAKRR